MATVCAFPVSVRRSFLPTVQLAALAAIGGMAVGDPAASRAAPADRELDVGAYDECYQKGFGQGLSEDEFFTHAATCCVEAGGTWNDKDYSWQAPPAEPAEIRPGSLPPEGITQTFTRVPAPPTPMTPTLAPAPNTRG